MLTHPNVLLLSTDIDEINKWESILCEHAVVTPVNGLLELKRRLESDVYDALFCGWAFRFGTWNDALRTVRQHSLDLPVIIFCGNGGEKEWVKVLDAGAFDLLVEPFHKLAVLPVLEHAIDSCYGRRLYHSPSRLRAVAS